jgi:hypothetical protein
MGTIGLKILPFYTNVRVCRTILRPAGLARFPPETGPLRRARVAPEIAAGKSIVAVCELCCVCDEIVLYLGTLDKIDDKDKGYVSYRKDGIVPLGP